MIRYDPNPTKQANFDWSSVDWQAVPWDLHWRIKMGWKREFKETWESPNGEWSGFWIRRCVQVDEFRDLITTV